jgi:DNA-binding SARP family transcriptional activator
MSLSSHGKDLALPTSRKVRALIAYLAMAPRPVPRTQLCELLGDVANDPRGELRWCLSKIRGLLASGGQVRVRAAGDSVSLELTDACADASEIARAMQGSLADLSSGRLNELAGSFTGEFLDSLELDRSPQLNAWIVAQRRRFHAWHAAVLEQLVASLNRASPEMFSALEKWLELVPLDRRAHERMLDALASSGRTRDGEAHLEATERLFEAEGLDSAPLRLAWHDALKRHRSAARSPEIVVASREQSTPAAASNVSPRRASIAVMPLVDVSNAEDARLSFAGPLAHDVITRLAILRSVAVISQGSVFALSERGMGAEAAGRALNVDYVASGSIRREKNRLIVMMELVETRTARIIWAEDYDHTLDEALLVLDAIGNRIVAALANEIETAERNRAMLKPPSSLDAWESLHRGLWHMYRFNAGDNAQAQSFLQAAVRLDPTFSRAHAALSFTHFQNAFLHRIVDRELEIGRAVAAAEQSLFADDRDPAAHLAMGRALWLRGEQDQSLSELMRAVELSPNLAFGHYTLAFVHSQAGDPRKAIDFADHSRELSPFDPLLFGMLACRAFGHLRLGQLDEAARWAVNATTRPNAHAHIYAIAAHCLAAASRADEARTMMARARAMQPRYSAEDYLRAFHFGGEDVAAVRRALRSIGVE